MLLKLFLTFFEIGAVSFGGGYGMISLIREKVLLHGWLSEAEFLSFIAVSESTPGPLAVDVYKRQLLHTLVPWPHYTASSAERKGFLPNLHLPKDDFCGLTNNIPKF